VPESAKRYRWADMPLEEVTPMLHRRLINSERMTVASVELKDGCPVPMHSHEHEQITYVTRGALRFWVGDENAESFVVKAGEVIHFPSNLPHKAVAEGETTVLDVFCPVREDWVNKTDDYLRK
jgi:quercetin dioxygenase-like cupin family protein